MWDEKSIYPKIETGYAFNKNMNDELVEKFNGVKFTQGSAILKIKHYNPKNLFVQHFPGREKVKNIEINRMRNRYITQIFTSVDIQQIVKVGGRVIQIYEGVIYWEIFEVNPVTKIIDEVFSLRQKYKDEGNDVMQLLVKLIMNALYGEFLRKEITESYQCKSEMWMLTDYEERVLDYYKINYGDYIVKLKDDMGLEDRIKKLNSLPLQLAVFILSNSKKIEKFHSRYRWFLYKWCLLYRLWFIIHKK